MFPGVIESESPVVPPNASVGIPHIGPWTRGKRKKSSTITGTPCVSSTPARRALSRSGRCGPLTPTSPAVSANTVTSMIAAVGIVSL